MHFSTTTQLLLIAAALLSTRIFGLPVVNPDELL